MKSKFDIQNLKLISALFLFLYGLCNTAIATDSFIQLPADGAGKKSRAVNQTCNSNDGYTSVSVIGDPADCDMADVDNTSSGAKGVDVIPLGKTLDDFYPYNTQPAYASGVTVPFAIEPDGKLLVHAAASTDEGSLFDTFPGSSLGADWITATGTGGSIAVSSGAVTIGGGTTANAVTYICQKVDYAPIEAHITMSISQRIANQDIITRFTDTCDPASIAQYAQFRWTGTSNTVVYAETKGEDAQTEGVATSLTQGASSNVYSYAIEFPGDTVAFSYDSTDTLESSILAQRSIETPNMMTPMYLWIGIMNGASAPGSNTNVVVKKIHVHNHYRLEMASSYASDPIKAMPMGVARVTLPTVVPDGRPVTPMNDTIGRQVAAGACPRDLVVQQQTTITNSTSETTILSAISGFHADITSLDITDATSTAVTITIKDSTAGTTRAIYDLAANGGIAKLWMTPFMQAAAVNNNWTATLSNNTTTVHFTVQGCKMP